MQGLDHQVWKAIEYQFKTTISPGEKQVITEQMTMIMAEHPEIEEDQLTEVVMMVVNKVLQETRRPRRTDLGR